MSKLVIATRGHMAYIIFTIQWWNAKRYWNITKTEIHYTTITSSQFVKPLFDITRYSNVFRVATCVHLAIYLLQKLKIHLSPNSSRVGRSKYFSNSLHQYECFNEDFSSYVFPMMAIRAQSAWVVDYSHSVQKEVVKLKSVSNPVFWKTWNFFESVGIKITWLRYKYEKDDSEMIQILHK